jgi:uncharacterized membrane protein YfcA
VLIFLVQGAFTRETLVILAVTTPFALVASQIGIVIFKRMEDMAFRRLLIVLMLVSGTLLMVRELL